MPFSSQQIREAADQASSLKLDAPPPFSDALRQEADHAVAGEIHFQGGVYVQIGRANIDWQGSHVAHHVWKERPKRFLYLPPLMSAYLATHNDAYAQAAHDYLDDWMRAHPAKPDWMMPSYDNGLNLGVRLPFFTQALHVFQESPAWDETFLNAVIDQISSELGYISAHLSPRGNFRMKQAMSLMECGLRLAFHDKAASWMRCGARVMNDAARRQVLADGAHIECSAGYHTWMTRLFIQCLHLAKQRPELGLQIDLGMVAKMVDYCVASTRPNGTFGGVNDTEGAWEGSYDNTADKLRCDFRRDFGLADQPAPTSQVFSEARQAFLRDSWDESAAYVTFDATRWGSAHGHLARNSIQLHAFGRTLLMDPGRIEYEMSDPLGPYGKSTRAHNTLNLNGWNQNTTNVDRFRAFHADGFDCISATYTGGYWPAPYGWWFFEGMGHGIAAIHSRHLFWVHGRFCLVIDEVTRWNEPNRGPDHESPFLELNWQLSPGSVQLDADRRQVCTQNAEANLLIHTLQSPAEAIWSLHEGETTPHRGWVRDYKRFGGTPAPQVSLSCTPWTGFSETIVTLLVPFRGETAPLFDFTITTESAKQAPLVKLDLRWNDGVHESVHWREGLDTMLGPVAGVDTDGLLFYQKNDGASAAVDSTYANGPEITSCQHLT